MEALCKVRFNVVSVSVHPGSSRYMCREIERELWIVQGERGDQVGTENHGFAICLFDCDNGGPSHFAAGAGRRGYRDEGWNVRSDVFPAVDVVVVLGK